MFFPYFSSGLWMIPELLDGTSHGFRRRVNNVLHMHQLLSSLIVKENRRRYPEFLNLLAITPFMSKIFNAVAKNDNSKSTKGEMTGMGTCKDVSVIGCRIWSFLTVDCR